LGVVTNCSERLGQQAAARLQVPLECVVTAERAGNYKPDPAPYRLALQELGLPAERVLFVAGSGFDLFGTARVGLATLWHNRVGLAAPDGAPAPIAQARTLRPMVDDLLALQKSLS
jgi:2-haloacid dehalogenase